MNYNEYMANIKAYKNGTLMQAAPTDALSDWHEKYFDATVSALAKKMVADHVEHSEDADKFSKEFVSMVAIMEEDGVSKQDIGKELEAVSKAAQSQADAAIKKIDSVQHSTDTLEGYQAAIKAYKEKHLEHGEWKKHKYIRIENGRYIYPEDLKKTSVDNRTVQGKIKDVAGKLNSALNRKEEKSSSDNRTVQGKLKDAVAPFKNAAKNLADAVKEHKAEKDAKLTKVDNEISKYVSKGSDSYNALMDAAKKIASEDSKANISVSYDKETGRVSVKNDDANYNPATQRQSTSSTSGASAQADPDTVKKIETAEKNKKEFEESTKQLSPQEQYIKEQAEKSKQNTPEKKTEAKSEYHKLAEESGLSDKDVDDIIASARYNYDYRYNAALKGAEQSAKKLGSGYKVKVEPHGEMLDFNIYDQSGNKVGKDVSIDNLDSDIKLQIKKGKDSVYLKFPGKKVQHSDPRAAFYAAVDEYKSKKRTQPAGPTLKHSSNSRDAYFSAIRDYEQAHLEHHGILGMKWGIRRYQNPDGSLTSAGKKRYQNPDGTLNEKGKKRLDNKSYENFKKKEDKEFKEFVKELNDPSPRSKMEIAEHDGKFDQEFLDKVKGEDWVSDDKREASINQKMLSEYKKYLDDPEKYSKRQEAKKEYLNNAKSKGLYDLNFLEAVQNEEWADSLSENYDKKRMLNEYSKYLDDPRDYWRYRDH